MATSQHGGDLDSRYLGTISGKERTHGCSQDPPCPCPWGCPFVGEQGATTVLSLLVCKVGQCQPLEVIRSQTCP
jgi:hypothetical protein